MIVYIICLPRPEHFMFSLFLKINNVYFINYSNKIIKTRLLVEIFCSTGKILPIAVNRGYINTKTMIYHFFSKNERIFGVIYIINIIYCQKILY